MNVVLSKQEAHQAALTGTWRGLGARFKGYGEKHGADPDKSWDNNVEGAAGELAFAKAFNLYWNFSVNTFKRGGDVGDIQVRTACRPDGDLIIRADDPRERLFVLVTGRIPTFIIRGWKYAWEVKGVDKYLKNPGNREPAWFLPQSELYPPEELLELIKDEKQNWL